MTVVESVSEPVVRETRGETMAVGIAKDYLNEFTVGYRNNKMIGILPTRGSLPIKVHVSLRNMAPMMNMPRAWLEEIGLEVADAYNRLVSKSITEPEVKDWPWVWTYEEDNIQPPDVFLKLFQAIWTCIDCGSPMPADKNGTPVDPWVCPNFHPGLDAVAGLYFTKSIPPFPMAYGDPKTDELEFRPRDVREAMDKQQVMEVNGVAMGCTLWRKKLFDKVSKPWFKTLSGGDGSKAYTQDLYFCRKAKEEASARFAVHCGCVVGHYDQDSGVCY